MRRSRSRPSCPAPSARSSRGEGDLTLHEGEADVGLATARRLLAAQFPELADLPLGGFASLGTVNATYRLGDELCVRLPRLPRGAEHLEKELTWLPRLATRLTLAVPEPVHVGDPDEAYPHPWAIYRWIEGEAMDADERSDDTDVAEAVAGLVLDLRAIDPSDGPPSGRAPLADLDAVTRQAIAAAGDLVDTDTVTAAWDEALAAPPWDGEGTVWRHCDLLPPNLVLRDGRLHGVLDFGGVGVGDPAIDVIAAWTVLGPHGREVFRGTLGVDDATWARARGVALHQALLIIPYYVETNPGFVTMAQRTVHELV